MVGFVVGFMYLEETKSKEDGYTPIATHEDHCETGCGSLSDNRQCNSIRNSEDGSTSSSAFDIEDADDIHTQGSGSNILEPSSEIYRELSTHGLIDHTVVEFGRESTSTAVNSSPRNSEVAQSKGKKLITQVQEDVNQDIDQDLERMANELNEKTGKFRFGAAVIGSVLAYGLLAFQCIIFDETFSLWVVTPPYNGKLDFDMINLDSS
jgi:hypothetical protein